jgi:hypothetical protein
MTRLLNIIPLTQKECEENETNILKMCRYTLSLPSVPRHPDHFVRKDGPSDMSTRWLPLLSSGVRTRLLSSPFSVSLLVITLNYVIRHYQDAYTTLATMFGSTIILPPRTKRWAEAKVLVDCINIKVGLNLS